MREGHKDVALHITDPSVFEEDLYLLPVMEDDAVLYSLEDVLSSDIPGVQADNQQSLENLGPEEKAVLRALKLEEELRQLQQRFEEYRQTVDRTLEDRWRDDDDEVKPSKATQKQDEPVADDNHYFQSYSYNGMDVYIVHATYQWLIEW